MRTGAEKSSRTASRTASPAAEGTFFARARPSAPPLQAKLTVNQPGDAFEQEADRMADKVTRMPAPAATGLRRGDGSALRRAADERLRRAEDDKLRKAEDDRLRKRRRPEKRARSRPGCRRRSRAGPAAESRCRAMSAGRWIWASTPISARSGCTATRRRPASATGFPPAPSPIGNHIFFGRTSTGRRQRRRALLAHELTHTIQQSEAVQREVDPAPDGLARNPGRCSAA